MPIYWAAQSILEEVLRIPQEKGKDPRLTSVDPWESMIAFVLQLVENILQDGGYANGIPRLE